MSRTPVAAPRANVPPKRRHQHLRLKWAIFVAACLLPGWGTFTLFSRGGAWLVPLAVYLLASLLTFALYWRDKRSARQDTWRVPEAKLHLSEMIGGWPGALLAQQVFRHKTRKLSYQLAFWAIVLLHQGLWGVYVFGLGNL